MIAFTAIFSNMCTAHAQQRLFIFFRVNLDNAVRFIDPDFLLECKISAIWRRVPFLLPVCFTYWPRKYTTRVDPHVDNSHQVWSWYDHTLPIYSVFVCWYVSWPWPLTFWPWWTVVLHGGSRDQPCHQVWRPYDYSFTSYNGFHWLPLKMHTQPLRMRRITVTWPVNRGSKTITFLESPTPICLFTIQLLLGYDDDISSTSKLIANFLLKFSKFSLLWQQGSSERSLTATI